MADYTLIQGPYGSERVPVPEVLDPGAPGAVAATPDGQPVLLNNDRVANQPGFREATIARDAAIYAPQSSALEGIGATINTWDTTRLIRRLGRPSFADDAPINQGEYLQNVPLVLNEEEREYFMDVGRGVQSAQYALEQIQDRRTAGQAIGDHPITGLATSFLDPLWLAVPGGARLSRLSPTAGRAVSAVTAAGTAGAVTAGGEGPVSDSEIAVSMLMNAAAGAALYIPGKGLVPADKDFPKDALNASLDAVQVPAGAPVKPHYKLVDGVPVEQPRELAPGYVNDDPATLTAAVDTAVSQDQKARGWGEKIMWNMHKTMSGYGEVGKKVANILYDNNSDLSLTSVEAHREAILSDLRGPLIKYEDSLRGAMAEDGAGLAQMVNPLRSREAYATQGVIQQAVQRELFRREQMHRLGLPVASDAVEPRIAKMADAIDELHKQALAELKASGVEGAEQIAERPGYLNRRWSSSQIDRVLDQLEAQGMPREKAHAKVVDLVALSLRRGSALTPELAQQVGGAIIDRALRKGYFEDAMFNAADPGTLAELRDILKTGGMSSPDVERVLDVVRVQTDEAGKAGILKHRMDLDYKATLRVGDLQYSIMDLIDSNVNKILDQYIQQVGTQAAFARSGLKKRSDVAALREELLHSVGPEQRKEAADLFDNTIAHMRAEPNGARVSENLRLMQSYTRSIALAWGGLWQTTEYATAMGLYGLRKVLKYGAQELPGFKKLLNPDHQEARSLNTVLADHSASSLRLRPYIARYEDGFEMDTGSALQLAAQTQGQLVPFANAMRFVHHHQARMVGNLILDRVDMASKGNAKAREALAKYGIQAPIMDKLAAEIKQHGFIVDDWDDTVWAQVRPAFAKMMDESVLRGRLGDTPAFVAFDQVGKFIFTYRTFVLGAHNKVLAGMAERNGTGAVGLVLMYQFPLALAAVQAQSVVKGDGVLDSDKMLQKALGQMGGLGLFSEPLKWATGESNSVGATGLIAVDRGVKLFQAGTNLDPANGASTALTMVPVASAVPFIRGIANQTKE